MKQIASAWVAFGLIAVLGGSAAAQSTPTASAAPELAPTVSLAPESVDPAIVLPAGQPAGAVPHPVVPSAFLYPEPSAEQVAGLSKIEHIVMIVQENRSFDHYFGTYPGAEGIPRKANGTFRVCITHPVDGSCVKPYHDRNVMDAGGPHHAKDHTFQVNKGRMNNFLKSVWRSPGRYGCTQVGQVTCQPGTNLPDVHGYKTRREIRNYWEYAERFVLQDHMFEPVRSYSLPAHLYLVSAWSARCDSPYRPMSCRSAPVVPQKDRGYQDGRTPIYAWTDITYLLREQRVSWRYYVGDGTPVDCGDGRGICSGSGSGTDYTTELWSPLNYFTTVQQARQADNIQHHRRFFRDLKNGKMANVIWVTPNGRESEHAPFKRIDEGQAWVTRVVNAIARSEFWDSTAIFVTWDDWGGFYDHVVPPVVDGNGYGMRVPGFLISPYAKRGFIDKQVLSFDAYLKFIEDVFLEGQRLDPKTMSRPDSRPTVREEVELMGDLIHEFDFTQEPRKPPILDRYP